MIAVFEYILEEESFPGVGSFFECTFGVASGDMVNAIIEIGRIGHLDEIRIINLIQLMTSSVTRQNIFSIINLQVFSQVRCNAN